MARVALVTGGTRGIGYAIFSALRRTATKSRRIMPAMTLPRRGRRMNSVFPFTNGMSAILMPVRSALDQS